MYLPHRIHALPSAIVGVIDVLEHGGCLLLEQFGCVGRWQTLIQQLLNGHPHCSSGLLALAPIKHELRLFERDQQLPGSCLHLFAVRSAHVNLRLGQEIEDCQLFFTQLFAHAPSLFLTQTSIESIQLMEELLGVEAASIICVDHRLEPLHIVHACAVEPYHAHEFLCYRALEFLVECALMSCLELLG